MRYMRKHTKKRSHKKRNTRRHRHRKILRGGIATDALRNIFAKNGLSTELANTFMQEPGGYGNIGPFLERNNVPRAKIEQIVQELHNNHGSLIFSQSARYLPNQGSSGSTGSNGSGMGGMDMAAMMAQLQKEYGRGY